MQFVSPLEHQLRLPNSSLLAIRDRRFHSLLTACFLCLLMRRFAPVEGPWSARSRREVFPATPQGSALRENFTSLWPEASAEARGLARSGPPATIEQPEGQTKKPARQALPTNTPPPCAAARLLVGVPGGPRGCRARRLVVGSTALWFFSMRTRARRRYARDSAGSVRPVRERSDSRQRYLAGARNLAEEGLVQIRGNGRLSIHRLPDDR
jgi:hypothetical protein